MNYGKTFFWLFFFVVGVLQAQSLLKGAVSNAKNESLSGATVILNPVNSSEILKYTITDQNGRFSLNFQYAVDSLQLKISHIGYSPKTLIFVDKSQDLSIKLEESSEKLKEVTVKSRRIEQRGDTLNYSVSAFTDQKDRVIADVLKKMPGIEVKANGQIFFEGEPIQKYYIEGLDLLEGRYNLANDNLPASAVSKVQVLQNHQPIKLLDSLVFSEKASLNIKLKEGIAFTGSAETGVGAAPALWDVNTTPMLFTKKKQGILSYQSNNIGKSVSRATENFSMVDFGRKEFDISERDLLGIRQLSEPRFSQERWLYNNAHFGSANSIFKLKKDVELKVNISYLNDAQEQRGSAQTRFFTPSDTIDLIEETRNDLFKSQLETRFILERNTDKDYLKNTLEVNSSWDGEAGIINRMIDTIEQHHNSPHVAVRNKLKLLKPVGKQLITFRSNTGFISNQENLLVKPAVFSEVFDGFENKNSTMQKLRLQSFFTDNSTGFTKAFGAFTISPEIGFSIYNQDLESKIGLNTVENGNNSLKNAQNNLKFNRAKYFVSTEVNYRIGDWRARLKVPFNYYSFTIDDKPFNRSQHLKKFTVEPDLYIKREFLRFWEISATAASSNDFGNVQQQYFGYILTDYRRLQRYNSQLLERFSQRYSTRLTYENPLNAVFANLSYTYSRRRNNLLVGNTIDPNGGTVTETFMIDNYGSTNMLAFRASKYIGNLNTTIALGSNFSSMEAQQLLNGTATEVNTNSFSFNLELNSELTEWANLNYRPEFSVFETSFGQESLGTIRTQKHLLDVYLYPNENQYVALNSEVYVNKSDQEQNSNYFLNLTYQYTFEQPKMDFQLSWNNITNAKEYQSIFNNEYAYVQNSYRLRPSQVVARLLFSF